MGKLCQYCNKREAKIHFTEIKDGKKTEMHICEQCAHQKNMVLAFPSLLQHIVKGGEGPAAPRSESDAVPASCPQCGLAYNDFKAKGRLGCPTCYRVFAPVLVPLLEKVHGSSKHRGRTPERPETPVAEGVEIPDAPPPVEELPPVVADVDPPAPDAEPAETDDRIAALEEELTEAVESEEYERAAEIRDRIRSLREEAGGES